MKIASIMTGTSVDGVDICLYDNIKKTVLEYIEFPFTKAEKTKIESFLYPKENTTQKISSFNFWFTNIIGKYFKKWNSASKADLVVFHGQTVFHDPDSEFEDTASTMQLGNGTALAQIIRKDVVWDLRSGDIALGGQGAPLVVYGDRELFFNGEDMAIVNIGGISNVTYLSENDQDESFDLGPGNALIDAYVKEEYNIPYDKDGEIAKSGIINKELLGKLMDDSFIKKAPPKTTGKERYNFKFLKDILKLFPSLNKEDIVATLTMFVAKLIIDQINLKFNVPYIYVSGGGANNSKLLANIIELKPGSKILNINNIDQNSREAVSFAVLGSMYIKDKAIGVITGSRRKYIAGSLAKYYKGEI